MTYDGSTGQTVTSLVNYSYLADGTKLSALVSVGLAREEASSKGERLYLALSQGLFLRS